MKPDLVSIIIPTFKRPSYLSRAILSALNQTYQNIEVLVIDDNDPVSIYRKETESLMFDFENNAKIKYIKHPKNLNGSAARNTGIKNSKGDFLAFLDDDDVFLPTKIEKQYNRLKHLNEDWGACYCFYSIYYNNKVQKYYDIEEEGDLTESILLMENPVASGSTLFIRKEVAVEFGGYNVSYQRHQDWEFLLRVLTKYKICQVKENLVNIYLESRINKLEPRFLVGTKLKFLNEFSNIINNLPKSAIIYKNHYLELANSFAERGYIMEGIGYLRKAHIKNSLVFLNYYNFLYHYVFYNIYYPLKHFFKRS